MHILVQQRLKQEMQWSGRLRSLVDNDQFGLTYNSIGKIFLPNQIKAKFIETALFVLIVCILVLATLVVLKRGLTRVSGASRYNKFQNLGS